MKTFTVFVTYNHRHLDTFEVRAENEAEALRSAKEQLDQGLAASVSEQGE